jgi:hypothetical protein
VPFCRSYRQRQPPTDLIWPCRQLGDTRRQGRHGAAVGYSRRSGDSSLGAGWAKYDFQVGGPCETHRVSWKAQHALHAAIAKAVLHRRTSTCALTALQQMIRQSSTSPCRHIAP